jgi:CRISPR-associated protein Cas1
MKQKAKSDKPFSLNSHVLERVKAWENLVSGGRRLRFKKYNF